MVKAAFTDFGFEIAVMSQQVFGGHGYIREWGMEQYVRDARITQIYEGTNGVQAMDLVGRKLPWKTATGAPLLRDGARGTRGRQAGRAQLGDAGGRRPGPAGSGDGTPARAPPVEAGAAAADYLRLFALVAFGWLWARMAAAAGLGEAASPVERRKVPVARFFMERMLPETKGLAAAIQAGAPALMALEPADF